MKIKGKGFQHCVKFDFRPREVRVMFCVYFTRTFYRNILHLHIDIFGEYISNILFVFSVFNVIFERAFDTVSFKYHIKYTKYK